MNNLKYNLLLATISGDVDAFVNQLQVDYPNEDNIKEELLEIVKALDLTVEDAVIEWKNRKQNKPKNSGKKTTLTAGEILDKVAEFVHTSTTDYSIQCQLIGIADTLSTLPKFRKLPYDYLYDAILLLYNSGCPISEIKHIMVDKPDGDIVVSNYMEGKSVKEIGTVKKGNK